MFAKYAFITRSLNTNLTCFISKKHFGENQNKIKPVMMSYLSYENTGNQHGGEKKCPILIMHGLLGSKNNWNSLSKVIHSQIGHKIVTVDARNHGDSPHSDEFNYECLVEDIRHLMAEIGIPKINAVGHSMGGRAMMLLALKYPHLVNSLIVVDISPVRTSPAIIDLSLMFDAMMAVKFESDITLSKARNFIDEQLKSMVPDNYIRQFLLTNLVEHERGRFKWRVNLKSLINNFSSIVNFKPPTSHFPGPVLFIGGSNSTFLKESDHKDIMNYFPRSEFRYIQGAGHWVHSEKPTEFLELTCQFLKIV